MGEIDKKIDGRLKNVPPSPRKRANGSRRAAARLGSETNKRRSFGRRKRTAETRSFRRRKRESNRRRRVDVKNDAESNVVKSVKNDATSTRFKTQLVFPSVFLRDGARRASKRKVRDVLSFAVLLDASKRFFANLFENVRKRDAQ